MQDFSSSSLSAGKTPFQSLSPGGRWFLIGLMFAVAQFTVSETFFQLADRGGPDFLYEVSDFIAWPAVLIYEEMEHRVLAEVLEDFSAAEGVDELLRAEAVLLLDGLSVGGVEAMDAAWRFAEDQDLEAEVSLLMEYVIYGGVCLLWGFMVGLGGYVVTTALKEPESFSL